MSTITANPYLFFKGEAREAMEFYKSIFGGELTFQTYGDIGAATDEMPAEFLMHTALEGGVLTLMASDTPQASPRAAKVSISLIGDDESKLRTIFERLSEDVLVTYPLKKESWGDIFGSVVDKFGIEWMVNISSGNNS